MTISYGAGLFRGFPTTAVDTPDKQCALLRSFFATGLVLELFEEIAGEVVRVSGRLEAPVIEHVADVEKAAAVRRALRLGGSRPAGHFAYLDGFQLFVPDDEVHGPPLELALPDGTVSTLAYVNTTTGLRQLEKINVRIARGAPEGFQNMALGQEEFLGFHRALIEDIRACARAGVVYRLS